jgi:NAD(P)-dependent dehydrogenase (short-subunit alcohol dehydrogenase family)
MQESIDSITKLKAAKTSTITGIQCDLKSFESVRKAAEEVNKKCAKIDICILNAGIMKVPFELVEKIEIHSAVNHFSHFLFLNLVYEKIRAVNGES